ncbi:Fmu (Sun) domain protein [uncultured delta proteobacterium]|uniref:Fmu (Sun) domain protein n=1 Tax=uncultured delta proteobacterium TaxID=34034 RepID=A0A212JYW3_9DELT|nr:Fmu (Sun) domain protein [uncultured delta proteobacterium]
MKNALQRGAANRSEHDPRAAALRVIDQTLTGKEPSQFLLDKALRESKMVPSDRGLCTELVYGFLRAAIRLDWNLRQLLRDADNLPPEMLLTLELAAYEIAHLRIPPHASVNWAVSRVRNRFGKGLAGVANGTLRAFARNLKAYKSEDRYTEALGPVEGPALFHGVPGWIAKLWLDAYGEETARAYLAASSAPAVPAVRINAAKEDAVTVRIDLMTNGQSEARPVGNWGMAFPDGVPYIARKLEKEGKLSYQSAAVQEVFQETDMPSWPCPVWDACAGRGGKTAAMLERGLSVSVASDIAGGRLAGLPGELQRLGFAAETCPVVLEADAAAVPDVPAFAAPFGTVLLDVPCSGLGTLARRPEIRFRRNASDIAALTTLQDGILDAASQRVRGGGRIVYITCTLNPAENEERVRSFLGRTPGFALDREWATPTDSPWHEFFYAAVLRKE